MSTAQNGTTNGAATAEPLHEIAQLVSVQIYSPVVDETVDFFTGLLGMIEVDRQGDSVYLRAYEDRYHHSLEVTARDTPGPGRTTWRTHSPQALERRAAAVEATGLGDGWVESGVGHGRAYQFETPDGHPMQIAYDVDRPVVAEADRSDLRSRMQKRPTRGVPVRRIDHLNYMASDVVATREFMADALGFRLSEHIVMEDGAEIGAWMRCSNLAHDVAFMADATGARGRLHHICFWYGYPQHVIDAADLCAEYGFEVEAGPGKHGVSQAFFLYCYEPGGNRIELFGDAGYLIFDPDWTPLRWSQDEVQKAIIWVGGELPEVFFQRATPHVVQEAILAAQADAALPERAPAHSE